MTKAFDRHVRTVRDQLRVYANRGVLRDFTERESRGKFVFTFVWLLDRKFTLEFDPAKSQLVLRNLLPNMKARSFLDRSIREFVPTRSAKKLLPHRRIDPARAALSCVNRGSRMSFVMDVKRNQYKYALPRLLNFCQELFGHIEEVEIEYMHQNMGLREE